MKKSYLNLLYVFIAAALVACGDGQDKEVDASSDRSVQYFPNMYQEVGYSTYGEGEIFPTDMEAQKPVEGTVSRGWMPYEYDDTNEGYASAKANLTNPLPYTEENVTEGQVLYNIYCAICHGEKGNGQGHLVKTEKILGVPSYDAREITQGSIYHVMYYGINYMGSYASQTSIEERWQIAHYVDKLTKELKGKTAREFEEGNNDGLFAAYDQDMNPENTEEEDNDSEIEQPTLQPGEIEEMEEETNTNTSGDQ